MDKPDEHVEEVPGGLAERWRDVEREEGYHREHDAAGQYVPEEPQGQGERADDLLDEVEGSEPGGAPRREEHVLDVVPRPRVARAVHVRPDDDEQRQGVGEVDIGAWRPEV